MGQSITSYSSGAVADFAGQLIKDLYIKVWNIFTHPPEAPPAPSRYLTREQMISLARERLKMDILNFYNFGICGQRGTDDCEKDAGLKHDPFGSAPTGEVECTKDVYLYRFPTPEFQYVCLWDLPGSGAPQHPAETYFKDKCLYAFDCLLI
ncbi:unnamed protein product, partial [Rotaria sp. Silwood2]